MKNVLLVWIENQTNYNKAQIIFNSLQAERNEEEKWEARRSWLIIFKERSHPKIKEKVQGEVVACADVEALAHNLENLAKIIDEGCYTKQEIFSVDETDLYWKKMLSRTFMARK